MLKSVSLIWFGLILPLADPSADEVLGEARMQAAARTQAALESSLSTLEKSLEKHASDARIHAAISETYSELTYYGFQKPYDAARKAKAAAAKAIELKPDSAEALTAQGIVNLYYDWNFPDAEASFKKAIEKNAKCAPAHSYYARCLTCQGKIKEALVEAQKAVESDPDSAAARVELGRVHLAAAEYDKAAEQFAKAIDLVPTSPIPHALLGITRIKQTKKTEGFASLNKAVEVSGREVWTVARLGAAESMAGNRITGSAAIGDISTLAGDKFMSAFDMALLYATIGEKEPAFTWLERAVEERAPRLIDLRYDPFFYRLHSELRFQDLLRQMNLPALKTP